MLDSRNTRRAKNGAALTISHFLEISSQYLIPSPVVFFSLLFSLCCICRFFVASPANAPLRNVEWDSMRLALNTALEQLEDTLCCKAFTGSNRAEIQGYGMASSDGEGYVVWFLRFFFFPLKSAHHRI